MGGCTISTPQVHPVRRRIASFEDYEDPDEPVVASPMSPPQMRRLQAQNIISGVSHVRLPLTSLPVVCLSEKAYPLLLADFGEGDQNPITLPIAAISKLNHGRIVFFGSSAFLSHSIMSSSNTSILIENTAMWASERKAGSVRILLLGFQDELSREIIPDLKSMGYQVESSDSIPSSMKFDLTMLSTRFESLQDVDGLLAYASHGSAIMCFADPECSDPATIEEFNQIFAETGLAFSKGIQKVKSRTIEMATPEALESQTLFHSADEFTEVLSKGKEANDDDLDRVVSHLRCFVAECAGQYSDVTSTLLTLTMNFLNLYDFDPSVGFFPDLPQQIVCVILCDLIAAIPASNIILFPHLEVFPGIYQKPPPLENFEIHIKMRAGDWTQTGLWLPPGTLATVEPTAPCQVLIGAHTASLLTMQGPWKRFPTVVKHFFAPENEKTEVSTPFGGIIYLVSQESISAVAKMQKFLRYPIYKLNSGDWEGSKNYGAPWGEICSDLFTLTIPRQSLIDIKNKEQYCARLDRYITEIHEVIGVSQTLRHRVVFDIDLPSEDPLCGDVIFMKEKCLKGALGEEKITHDYASMLVCIAFNSLNGAFFDSTVETAVSDVIVASVIKKLDPSSEAIECVGNPSSKVFGKLWLMTSRNGLGPITKAIMNLRENHDIHSDSDAWVLFIRSLEKHTSSTLSDLEKSNRRPGTLQSFSSDNLQKYIIGSKETEKNV